MAFVMRCWFRCEIITSEEVLSWMKTWSHIPHNAAFASRKGSLLVASAEDSSDETRKS